VLSAALTRNKIERAVAVFDYGWTEDRPRGFSTVSTSPAANQIGNRNISKSCANGAVFTTRIARPWKGNWISSPMKFSTFTKE